MYTKPNITPNQIKLNLSANIISELKGDDDLLKTEKIKMDKYIKYRNEEIACIDKSSINYKKNIKILEERINKLVREQPEANFNSKIKKKSYTINSGSFINKRIEQIEYMSYQDRMNEQKKKIEKCEKDKKKQYEDKTSIIALTKRRKEKEKGQKLLHASKLANSINRKTPVMLTTIYENKFNKK